MIGHDREARFGLRRTVDPPDAGVVGVPEVGEPCGALAQRELECRQRGELRTDAQDLQQLPARVVDRDDPLAHAVREERRFRSARRFGGHRHRPCPLQPPHHHATTGNALDSGA